GEGEHVLARQILGCGHQVDEFKRLLVEVSAALRHELLDRIDRLGAWAHRVLVGVDLHRVGREPRPRRESLGQRRLVVERQGRAAGYGGGEAAELRAAEAAMKQVPPLLRAEQVLHGSSWVTSSKDGPSGGPKGARAHRDAPMTRTVAGCRTE